MRKPNPGISGMSLFVPDLCVSLQDWCDWTGQNWDKVQNVVGQSFRMPRPDENVYTLAATAVLKLILAYEIDPRQVGFLALGTESAVDNAAGAVLLRGMLDVALQARGLPPLSPHCEVPELKQACLGGVYALKQAVRYLALDGQDKLAIVATGDIAEYARGSSGEQTQGAGAVALLLEAEPQLLEVDLFHAGSASAYRGPDWRKPTRRFSMPEYPRNRHHDFPVFNGPYSTHCYLDATLRASEQMFSRLEGDPWNILQQSKALFFHRPYQHMPLQAATLLYLRALASEQEPQRFVDFCQPFEVDAETLQRELQQEPWIFANAQASAQVNEDPRPQLSQLSRHLRKTAEFRAWQHEKMSLGAQTMQHLGNVYTASLPAWLAAGLEAALAADLELAEETLLAFAYGSGDAAEALPLRGVPGWRSAAAKIGFQTALDQPLYLNQDQYIELHDLGTLTVPESQIPRFAIERIGQSQTPEFQDIGLEYYTYLP